MIKELIDKITASMVEEPDKWEAAPSKDYTRLSYRDFSVDDDDGFMCVSDIKFTLGFWQMRRLKKAARQLVVEKALRKWDREE